MYVKLLNSMARQSMAERAWASISRFYDNCKKKVKGILDSHGLKNLAVRLNTKLADGNYQMTGSI